MWVGANITEGVSVEGWKVAADEMQKQGHTHYQEIKKARS
jgi:hypothetical protein